MILKTTLLCKRPVADFTHVLPYCVMRFHMLPQYLLSVKTFIALLTNERIFPASMLQHMIFQLRYTPELHIANVTVVPSLHQVIFTNVLLQLGAAIELLTASLTLEVKHVFQSVSLLTMVVPFGVIFEFLGANVTEIAFDCQMDSFYMVSAGMVSDEGFGTLRAREGISDYTVGAPVVPQCIATVKACFANLANVVIVMRVHVDYERFERAKVGVASDATVTRLVELKRKEVRRVDLLLVI